MMMRIELGEEPQNHEKTKEECEELRSKNAVLVSNMDKELRYIQETLEKISENMKETASAYNKSMPNDDLKAREEKEMKTRSRSLSTVLEIERQSHEKTKKECEELGSMNATLVNTDKELKHIKETLEKILKNIEETASKSSAYNKSMPHDNLKAGEGLIEKTETTMQKQHRKIIQTHFQVLVKNVEPNAMMEYLHEKGIISVEDMEVICSKDTPEKINEALLLQLEREGLDAFKRFFEGLQKNQPSLAEDLLKKERKQPSQEKLQDIIINIPSTSYRTNSSASEFRESHFQDGKHVKPSQEKIQNIIINIPSTSQGTSSLATEILENHPNDGKHVKPSQEKIQNKKLNNLNISHGKSSRASEFRERHFQEVPKHSLSPRVPLPPIEHPAEGSVDLSAPGKSHLDRESLPSAVKTPTSLESNGKEKVEFEQRHIQVEGPSGLSDVNDSEERPENSTREQSRGGLESEGMTRGCQTSEALTCGKSKFSQKKEYYFKYKKDFDKNGVIYYLGRKAGKNTWKNPALEESKSGVKVTFCGGHQPNGSLPEVILQYCNPQKSYTCSGWCLDLGEKYTLQLTHYTLRQIGSNDKGFLQKFEVHGRPCKDGDWCLLSKEDQADWNSQKVSYVRVNTKRRRCKTKTWTVEGESKPCRYFKIVVIMKENVSGKLSMSLAGVELYGCLSELELA